MPVIKGLEWTFDIVASTYAKLRPGYVDELYQMLFDYTPINESSNVIEVGIGGGQATLPILQTGSMPYTITNSITVNKKPHKNMERNRPSTERKLRRNMALRIFSTLCSTEHEHFPQ